MFHTLELLFLPNYTKDLISCFTFVLWLQVWKLVKWTMGLILYGLNYIVFKAKWATVVKVIVIIYCELYNLQYSTYLFVSVLWKKKSYT